MAPISSGAPSTFTSTVGEVDLELSSHSPIRVVINGRMMAGFAMVVFPADDGVTGMQMFLVNHYGVVDEKDLRS